MSRHLKEQFNSIANQYDADRRKFIPCFDEFYDNTTNFIAENCTPPKRILDLGAGTGLLTRYWHKHFAEAEYVLTDVAEGMLQIAKERFKNSENVHCEISDYSQTLPQGAFDCILSGLSIHHLETGEKQNLFSRIYDKLPARGLFVNYDQFCADSDELNAWYDITWLRHLENSGLSDRDIALWRERRKLDREISVATELKLLQGCNFKNVQCVYSYQKFAVLLAIK